MDTAFRPDAMLTLLIFEAVDVAVVVCATTVILRAFVRR